MYDEENVDIEEQIYNRVLQEEIEQEQKEMESLNEEDEDSKNINEDDDDVIEVNGKITKNSFIFEQTLPDKKKKKYVFTHKPSNVIFEASVIGQDRNNTDKFVFKAKPYKTDENDKIRIFNFKDLKNIRYK